MRLDSRALATAALVAAIGLGPPAILFAAPAYARPGLQTAIQDDVQLLHSPPQEIVAAMTQVRELGVDRVRLSASWSSLTRDPGSNIKPQFDSADPAAYEQSKWGSLDFAVRAAHILGLKVMIDIAFWAPRWAGRGTPPRVRQAINPREFAQFAQAVSRRYSGGFVPSVSADTSPSPPSGSSGSSPPNGGGAGSTPGPVLPGLPPPPLALAGAARPPRPRAATDQNVTDQSLAALAQAAASAGSPLPQVDMFTLWNEPNHPAFMAPQWTRRHGAWAPASPAAYRRMVDLGYPAIKAVQPDAQVLIGNTSSEGERAPPDPVAPLKFLRTLACVNGHFRPLHTHDCAGFHTVPGDGWAQHPYSLTGTPAKKADPRHPDDIFMGNLGTLAHTLDRLVAMHRLTPGMRSIYITEYGYETHRLKDRPALSPVKQARYLTWGEYLASKVPAVKLFTQFLLRDQPPSATVQVDSPRRPHGQFYSGLEYADGTPKLSMRTFVAGLFAARLGGGKVLLWGRLRLGGLNYRVAVQHRSGRRQWHTIATSPHPGGSYVAGFTLPGQDSFQRYALGSGRGEYRVAYQAPDGSWAAGLPVPAVSHPG